MDTQCTICCTANTELVIESHRTHIHIVVIMEEVTAMLTHHNDSMSITCGADPLLIHSADFGWVERVIVYWNHDIQLEAHTRIDTYMFMSNGTTLAVGSHFKQPSHWLPAI